MADNSNTKAADIAEVTRQTGSLAVVDKQSDGIDKPAVLTLNTADEEETQSVPVILYDYPDIGPTAFARAAEKARDNAIKFFNDFYGAFTTVADERGLTDQLLLIMKENAAALEIVRATTNIEATQGYDYAWRWSARTAQHTRLQKVAFLQAKSYKPVVFGGQTIQVADFTYSNNHGRQMDLLNNTVNDPANVPVGGGRVIGGYLMYSPRAVQYIPIADVRQVYRQAINQGFSGAAINRYMSNWFYSANYDIQHIYDA